MNNLKAVFTFGWPYMRQYWGRLVLGIFFGVLFGASNGSFIWAMGTLAERFSPKADTNLLTVQLAAQPDTTVPLRISARTNVSLLTTNLSFSPTNWNVPQNVLAKVEPKKLEPEGSSWRARAGQWLNQLDAKLDRLIDPWLPITGGIYTW